MNSLVRLTPTEVRQAQRAGYLLHAGSRKSSFFGGMFSWMSGIRFGAPTFWGGGANASPPINQVTSTTGQIVSPETALALSAVWACAQLNARTMASLPLELKRYASTGKSKLEESDPLFRVLRRKPNRDMTAYAFWLAFWMNEQFWGTGYAEKKLSGGKVIALELLLSRYMTPYLTEKKVLRYRYDDPLNPRDFSSEQIFRVFTRSMDGLTGMSVIEFARNSMGLAQSGEFAAAMTFKKGLNASGFVKVDKFLNETQRTQFRESISDFTGDGRYAGGTMVLEGGVDYKQLSMKPLDVELLASRKFSVEDVCRWFNVPPILIGHASEGQTMWGSGVEQIFTGWSRLSLRPYTTACQQSADEQLVPVADRDTLLAEYDLDDLLAADSLARSQLYSSFSQNGIKTRNELRAKEGDSPLPGGDILTVQSNLVPLDQLGTAEALQSTPENNLAKAIRDMIEVQTRTAAALDPPKSDK